jgi:hypothetical protein
LAIDALNLHPQAVDVLLAVMKSNRPSFPPKQTLAVHGSKTSICSIFSRGIETDTLAQRHFRLSIVILSEPSSQNNFLSKGATG